MDTVDPSWIVTSSVVFFLRIFFIEGQIRFTGWMKVGRLNTFFHRIYSPLNFTFLMVWFFELIWICISLSWEVHLHQGLHRYSLTPGQDGKPFYNNFFNNFTIISTIILRKQIYNNFSIRFAITLQLVLQ